MKKQVGFTLIEVLLLIIVSSILAMTILLSLQTATKNMPNQLYNMTATQTAKLCLEWFVGQRRLQWGNGYLSVTCPSTAVPFTCVAPSGYTLSVDIACTTINSDANYKTITITVTGSGNATLSALIANY